MLLAGEALIDRLRGHRTLQSVPNSEIQWVAAHGRIRDIAKGGILTPKEGPVEGLHIVLDGHLAIYVDKGTGPKMVMEWRGGDVTGVLPYSRIVAPPGDVVAQEASTVVTVLRGHLVDLTHQCPELTGILVHVMVDRARHFTSSFLHDEKLVSLGKLAAGLAHELNNPASAIARSAGDLAARLGDLEAASRLAGIARLTDSRIEALHRLCESVVHQPVQSILSPLEQEEREEAIGDWLEGRDVEAGLAESLLDEAVTVEVLDRAAEILDPESLGIGLRWFGAALGVRRLGAQIKEASVRVHDLVSAVKGFTQMDRAGASDKVDVGGGLSNTLIVLGAKARAKSVAVRTDIDPGLPPVRGSAGELNQVWSNLIDNALDAVGDRGHVQVIAKSDGPNVVVRIVDDGPGISAEVRDRVFDPFFTTKPVGAGTGLGLDIVRRLVQRHAGRIDVNSGDGGTEFCIRLPAFERETQVEA